MTGLLAIVLGLAAVGYAGWPWLVGAGAVRPLKVAPPRSDLTVESQFAALRDWSVAAGELRGSE